MSACPIDRLTLVLLLLLALELGGNVSHGRRPQDPMSIAIAILVAEMGGLGRRVAIGRLLEVFQRSDGQRRGERRIHVRHGVDMEGKVGVNELGELLEVVFAVVRKLLQRRKKVSRVEGQRFRHF